VTYPAGMRDSRPLAESFADHVDALTASLEGILDHSGRAEGPASQVLFDAGLARNYARDDQEMPFRPCPYIARWVPEAGPGDLLLVRPGATPCWFRVVPTDYWNEPRGLPLHPAVEHLAIAEYASREAAVAAVAAEVRASELAVVGASPDVIERLELPPDRCEPARLLDALAFDRSHKTDYEIHCIRAALGVAARGHAAIARALAAQPSEYALHQAYLNAAELLDLEMPYSGIVAWDDHAAILHYQSRRRTRPDPGAALLVDSGAAAWGYACDVTRTYVVDAIAPFCELLRGMQDLQRSLVEAAIPGQDFVELHARALEGIASLLSGIGVLNAPIEQALEAGWIDYFMPHGLGHHLGLQVHDVGGHMLSPSGDVREPPSRWTYLRTTRPLEVGNVITIEPGVYFMPTKLAELRAVARGAFDWGLLRELQEFGGIRIEDDVWVTPAGAVDLSRPLIP